MSDELCRRCGGHGIEPAGRAGAECLSWVMLLSAYGAAMVLIGWGLCAWTG